MALNCNFDAFVRSFYLSEEEENEKEEARELFR